MKKTILFATMLLVGCDNLRTLRELRDTCLLDVAVEYGPVVLDANPLTGTCSNLFRWQTTGPGSLELDGCTHVEEPEIFDCGVDLHFTCPIRFDTVGTEGVVELAGSLVVEDLRDGPVGEALVTVTHPDGWTVCEGTYELDAWPATVP